MSSRPGSATTGRDRPDPNGRIVRIFDTERASEALVVKGLLNSVGIDCAIGSIEAVQDTFPGVGGTVIFVRAEDAVKARTVIEESQQICLEDMPR